MDDGGFFLIVAPIVTISDEKREVKEKVYEVKKTEEINLSSSGVRRPDS